MATQKWQYTFVEADSDDKYWRPRWVNDEELSDWKKGPTLTEYANQMGEQGWELVGAPYTTWSGQYSSGATARLIFKRAKA